jgi:hypothetical protein
MTELNDREMKENNSEIKQNNGKTLFVKIIEKIKKTLEENT